MEWKMTKTEIKLHQVWNNLVQELQRNRVGIKVSANQMGAELSLIDIDSGVVLKWHEAIPTEETKELEREFNGDE